MSSFTVSKTAPNVVSSGSPFTYTITISKADPTIAYSATVSDMMQSSLTVVSARASSGSVSTTPSGVVWVIPLSHRTETLAITAIANTIGCITNTATYTITNPFTHSIIQQGTASATVNSVQGPEPNPCNLNSQLLQSLLSAINSLSTLQSTLPTTLPSTLLPNPCSFGCNNLCCCRLQKKHKHKRM